MSTDPFHDAADSPVAGARAPFAVTPSDSAELPVVPKGLYVGTGGTVIVRGVAAAADVAFRNVPSGFVIDVQARFVRASGTTAADIVALA